MVPDDLSGLHAILIGLYSDRESAHSVVRRLPDVIQYPPFENIEDVWAAILQEASKMDVISVLDIIDNEDKFSDRPNLIRAARRCQQRWKPDFDTIMQLAESYQSSLDAIDTEQNSTSSDLEWVDVTIHPRRQLRRLTIEVEKSLRWWARIKDVDDQAITDLLRQSQELLDLLREGGTSSYRRCELLEDLRSLEGDLASAFEGLAAARR